VCAHEGIDDTKDFQLCHVLLGARASIVTSGYGAQITIVWPNMRDVCRRGCGWRAPKLLCIFAEGPCWGKLRRVGTGTYHGSGLGMGWNVGTGRVQYRGSFRADVVKELVRCVCGAARE
jgi:hypothetical protein